ncbi:cupin domain-containing protein [candidate division KSB1 bacterium]|nr:cupin domain-containing protein [candidate division KSB1 bacterium]
MIKNIFENIPEKIPEEIFEAIISTPDVSIERIISKGHSSQKDFWYDQDRNEWVVVLKGHARLKFFEDEESVELKPGDYINIPAHCKHRVEWTDPDEATIWLAIHY